MIRKTSIFLALIGLLFYWGCNQQPAQDPNEPGDPKDGYIQEIEAIGYHFAGEPSASWKKYESYWYDGNGKVTQYESYWDLAKSKITTTYDEKGRILQENRTGDDRIGKVQFNYTYSPDGLTITKEEYSLNEGKKLIMRTIRIQNAKGQDQEVIEQNHMFPEVGVDTMHTIYRYDERGFLADEDVIHMGNRIPSVHYERDDQGRCTRLFRYDAEKNISRTERFEYDKNGFLYRTWAQDQGQPAMNLIKEEKWARRDKDSVLVEEHRYGGRCDSASVNAGGCQIIETHRYTYDDQDRVTSKATFKSGSLEPSMQLRYNYLPFKR